MTTTLTDTYIAKRFAEIRKFEGNYSTIYLDKSGYPTIGYEQEKAGKGARLELRNEKQMTCNRDLNLNPAVTQ